MRTGSPQAVFDSRRLRASALLLTLLISAAVLLAKAPQALPNRANSVKFAAIGDNGTGSSEQIDVGKQMVKSHASFPFDFVIMLGDNMYGSTDFVKKFEQPYAALLTAGVKFQASLGNHDDPGAQINYGNFNMNGQRYYSFVRGNVRFFALDSTDMSDKQLAWIDTSLGDAREAWKICFFHHPLYSNAARHGSQVDIRVRLEPLLVKHHVDVVFSGHDHVYERLKPQKGIAYFVSGAGGQLRRGNIRPDDETAAYFDQDRSFMLIEIAGSELHFQSVSRTGSVVDSGVITRQATLPAARPEAPVAFGGVR
jgi:predicted phosphodiesterase